MQYLILAMRTSQFQQSSIEPHKQYLAELRQQGLLRLTGPFTDKSGGAYLISAKDFETAKAIAFNDPIHTSGSSILTVYEWDAV